MKAIIMGPRPHFTDEEKFAWLQLEIELEELPKAGEHITLNGGSGWVVESVEWDVTGPANEAYYGHRDYKVTGVLEEARVHVRPDSGLGSEPFHDYACGVKEGTKAGDHEARAELIRVMSYTGNITDIDALRSVIFSYAAGLEKATDE